MGRAWAFAQLYSLGDYPVRCGKGVLVGCSRWRCEGVFVGEER